MRSGTWQAALLVLGLLARASAAEAQTPSTKVTAEALFEEARKLMAEGKVGEACPKFAASQHLDPSPATLLNLANCFEKQGRLASAWATYKEAASAASAAGRKEYVAAAERHAAALAPNLARLTIVVGQPVEGIRIERDGVMVDRAEWGTPIPVDSGHHAVTAMAPGHRTWSSASTALAEGSQLTVNIPALEALPAEPAAAPAVPSSTGPAASSPASASPGAQEQTSSSGSSRPIIAAVAAGAGVVGLGIGTVLAVVAKNKFDDSLKACLPTNHNLCTQPGVNERNDARSLGNAATLAFALGGAALAAGAVVWLTGGSSSSAAEPRSASLHVVPAVLPTFAGASLEGSW